MNEQPVEENTACTSNIHSAGNGAARAREILDSLKEQRESLVGRFKRGNGPQNKNSQPDTLLAVNKAVSGDAPLSLHLQDSLQMRQHMVHRRWKSASNNGSVGGSDTKNSVGTRSTVCTNESSAASPDAGNSTQDGVLLNRSIHVPNEQHELRELSSLQSNPPLANPSRNSDRNKSATDPLYKFGCESSTPHESSCTLSGTLFGGDPKTSQVQAPQLPNFVLERRSLVDRRVKMPSTNDSVDEGETMSSVGTRPSICYEESLSITSHCSSTDGVSLDKTCCAPEAASLENTKEISSFQSNFPNENNLLDSKVMELSYRNGGESPTQSHRKSYLWSEALATYQPRIPKERASPLFHKPSLQQMRDFSSSSSPNTSENFCHCLDISRSTGEPKGSTDQNEKSSEQYIHCGEDSTWNHRDCEYLSEAVSNNAPESSRREALLVPVAILKESGPDFKSRSQRSADEDDAVLQDVILSTQTPPTLEDIHHAMMPTLMPPLLKEKHDDFGDPNDTSLTQAVEFISTAPRSPVRSIDEPGSPCSKGLRAVRIFDGVVPDGKKQHPYYPSPYKRDANSVPSFSPLTAKRNLKPAVDRRVTRSEWQDAEIPCELSLIDKGSTGFHKGKNTAAISPRRGDNILGIHNHSPGSSSTASDSTPSSPLSPSVSLGTKKERAAYIGKLYGSPSSSDRRKLLTPVVRPSTGLRRHERNQINRVMLRGRVGILKNTNQKVFVTKEITESSDESMLGTVNRKPSADGDKTPELKQTSFADPVDKDLMDISLVNDHEKRHALILSFQDDLASTNSLDKKKEYMACPCEQFSSQLSSSSSVSSTFMDISDDSSCDFTTSSETTGWASSTGDSTLYVASESMTDCPSVVSGMTMPPLSPLSPERHRIHEVTTKRASSVDWKVLVRSDLKAQVKHEIFDTEEMSARVPEKLIISKDAVTRVLLSTNSKSVSSIQKLLFVAGRAADALCKANGGHFAIATRSGMVLGNEGETQRKKVRNIVLATPTFVRLSTDFRCGTYGSLYDIAVRSGCKVHEPMPLKRQQRLQPTSRSTSLRVPGSNHSKSKQRLEQGRDKVKGFLPARGGFYDTALQSGLTKEAIRSRTPFSVTTNQPPLSATAESSSNRLVVAESISDLHCGASGTLSMLTGYPPVNVSRYLSKSKKALYAIVEAESTSQVEGWGNLV